MYKYHDEPWVYTTSREVVDKGGLGGGRKMNEDSNRTRNITHHYTHGCMVMVAFLDTSKHLINGTYHDISPFVPLSTHYPISDVHGTSSIFDGRHNLLPHLPPVNSETMRQTKSKEVYQ